MSSKGITPVIATVLLILISVAATVTVFTFLTGIQKQTQESYEQKFSDQELRSQSDIGMDFVYNKSTYLFLNVRNTGSITLPVKEGGEKRWNIFVEGGPVPQSEWEIEGKEGENDVFIDAQETLTFNTTEKFPSEGEDKAIKVTAPYENSVSVICYNSGAGNC